MRLYACCWRIHAAVLRHDTNVFAWRLVLFAARLFTVLGCASNAICGAAYAILPATRCLRYTNAPAMLLLYALYIFNHKQVPVCACYVLTLPFSPRLYIERRIFPYVSCLRCPLFS